ncbi:hypothetical protein [Bartonella harrusi]|uniref:17 kDa surface antigen n=1 Tax=Bartonella harrusi TaxID=2961895 RepID=A0ABY5EQR3_9HYPH|nr:hypothetical protein [Bartonella harrusi]UTO27736.1 hypothetical protein NMK50_05630 [Bartonella harrusi]
MGSSSSSRDSDNSSHSSSWFHSDRCDAGGYTYDVVANGIKGAVIGGAIGGARGGLAGAGYGAAIGAVDRGADAWFNKLDECTKE